MAIIYDEKNKLITIHTNNSSYQMKVDEYGALLHTYYGERIDGTDMSYRICRAERGFSGGPYAAGANRAYSLDLLPQEYSCFGTGDFRTCALRVQNQDGGQGVELRFVDAQIQQGKYSLQGLPAVHADSEDAETLIVQLKDPYSGVTVRLLYGVLPQLDVITRAAIISNGGSNTIQMQKAASLSIDWQFGKFDLLSFYGRHVMERNLQRTAIHHGIQSVGSVRGNSSHHYNPFTILCDYDATEEHGSCYGFHFLYSGEFLFEAEYDQANQTRLVFGIHPDNFLWALQPGESFTTPEVMMAFSSTGLGKLSRLFHKAIREHVCRGIWMQQPRPVLINSWEGTYFDFTGDKLVSIAQEAANVGMDMLVMDDGWFGRRNDDNSSLGDWFPNEEKLGGSLQNLVERIAATGMKFGIWFEPEGISEDSDLYRSHPDWAVKQPGRKPALSRNQLVLDLSRQDVQDYLIERMSAILKNAPISYVKWDMNRSICDKYSNSLDAQRQGEFAHRYILGLYHILETLNQRFPQVLFESCSGGGGRFDAGMLYYTPQIWCSDNTDPFDRLRIQYGTSFGYPVSSMGAHVSAAHNLHTDRITSLVTRGTVAMSGTFGYELDITKTTPEERKIMKEQISLFHQYYTLIQFGDYYRLTLPSESCTAWEFAGTDGAEALIQAVYHGVEGNPIPTNVRVLGLQDNQRYLVELVKLDDRAQPIWLQWSVNGQILTGSALMHGGLTLPLPTQECQAFQIHIRSMGGKTGNDCEASLLGDMVSLMAY